jgi:hypothetical protein
MSTCSRVLGSAIIAGCLVWGQSDTVITPKQKNWDERANRGECTIRVWVDDEADIELRGNSVRIRSLAGQPGRDDGSECNQPLPVNLTSFEFKGIDGRGEVRLVQEPRPANNWTAVVNIKDRKGGGEGYTFRLRWESSGGYAANPNQSIDQRDRRGRNPGERRTNRGRNTSGNTSGNTTSTGTNLPWWGSGNTSGNTTNLGSTFNLNQSGSGSLDLDGRNWQINRTQIDARSSRDVRIFLTPTSGREFEFRGEITRQQGSTLELNIIDSTEGRASGRMTVNVLGNNGVDSLSMTGTMNNRPVRADFRR